MTEEEMEKIADMISNKIFAKIEADTEAFNEEFVDSLPSNEEQIAELQMLLLHYENRCFTKAYHLRRGYCCDNGCKHCPYKNADQLRSTKDNTFK